MVELLVKSLAAELSAYRVISTREKCIRVLKKMLLAKLAPIDRFSWPHGLMTFALAQIHCHTPSAEIKAASLGAMEKYFDEFAEKGMVIYNLEDAMNGYALLYLEGMGKRPAYGAMIRHLAAYLKQHPRATDGSLPYRGKQTEEVYVDAIGMICPFLARHGMLYGDEESIAMAENQIECFLSSGMDQTSGLPYQAYHGITGEKLGILGWGRSVGWLLLGMVETLACLQERKEDMAVQRIKAAMEKLLQNIASYQRQDGSYPWQITAPKEHKDTSAGAMIAYSALRGMERGIVDHSHWSMAEKSLESLLQSQRNGKIYDCSGECGGFGLYSGEYDAFPWSLAPAAAALAVYDRMGE